MYLQQSLLVTMVCELVRDCDSIYKSLIIRARSSLTPSAHSTGKHLDLKHHLFDLSYALYRAGRSVPLLRKPLRNV